MSVCDDIHGCDTMSLGQMENERGWNCATPFNCNMIFDILKHGNVVFGCNYSSLSIV
jgi:hypothetical protein